MKINETSGPWTLTVGATIETFYISLGLTLILDLSSNTGLNTTLSKIHFINFLSCFELDPLRSATVKSTRVVGLPVYEFLLVFNGNT